MSGAGAAAAALTGIAHALLPTMDDAIGDALDTLISQAEAVNPVRTGRMRAGYFKDRTGPGQWDFGNEMDYAEWVIGGTRRRRPNAALNAVLDRAETDIGDALDVAITRLVRDGR